MKTILLKNMPTLLAGGAVVGKKEAEGPLGEVFDYTLKEGHFGQKTWEQAERELQSEAVRFALDKTELKACDLDCIFSGDLLNQCVASSFAHRTSNTAYIGLYGACSTFAEGLALSALLLNAGYVSHTATSVSSHFCAAERQYRYPNEYGGQRTPTAQWTVTGAGCVIMGAGEGPKVESVTIGKIVDAGITDVNNMGAAMAPAAYVSIHQVFCDTQTSPEDYDLIVTGDLGRVGSELLEDLFRMEDGISLGDRHYDCGCAIFDPATQDVKSGGSGAGCSAVVFSAHILKQLQKGALRRVLFAGTGALLSPLTVQQGETIPCICHAVSIKGGV